MSHPARYQFLRASLSERTNCWSVTSRRHGLCAHGHMDRGSSEALIHESCSREEQIVKARQIAKVGRARPHPRKPDGVRADTT